MTEAFARLKPVAQLSDSEREGIQALAARDNHLLMPPTHAILKHQSVAGHVCLCNTPIVLAHFGLQEISPRDSFNLIHIIEQLILLRGGQRVIWPIGQTSPFHPLMERMGYQHLVNVDLFHKTL